VAEGYCPRGMPWVCLVSSALKEQAKVTTHVEIPYAFSYLLEGDLFDFDFDWLWMTSCYSKVRGGSQAIRPSNEKN